MPALESNVVSEIVGRVTHALREALSGVTIPGPRRETPVALAEATVALRQGASQSEILRTLLRATGDLGARAALFVARGDAIEGWEANGFENDPAVAGSLRGVNLSREQPTVSAVFSDEVSIRAEVGGAFPVPDFGQAIRGEALLVPLEVQGKIVALLYADPAGVDAVFDRHAIEALTEVAGLSIERAVLARAVGQRPASETGPQVQVTGAQPRQPEPAPVERVAPAASSRPEMPWPGLAVAAPPSVPQVTAQGSPEIEDARRYARLLMEEILLYHGDRVEEGRMRQDLQTRLSDELEKARQLYDRRVEQHVRVQGEFFEEALVRVLGGGDPRALGTQ